jgi:hypothetical protein
VSRPLQYDAICGTCQKRMRAGAEATGSRHPDGHMVYFHAPECPSDAAAPVAPRKRKAEDIYDLRQCSNAPCSNAVGTAYPKGGAPPVCERCGSAWEWTSEDGWAEEAAA